MVSLPICGTNKSTLCAWSYYRTLRMGDLKHVYTEGFSESILPCYDYYFIQFWKRKNKICCLRCLCTNDTEKWKGILLLLANYCISFINPNLRSIFRRCLYTICSKSQCPLFHLLQNAKLRESNLRWNMKKKNPQKNCYLRPDSCSCMCCAFMILLIGVISLSTKRNMSEQNGNEPSGSWKSQSLLRWVK